MSTKNVLSIIAIGLSVISLSINCVNITNMIKMRRRNNRYFSALYKMHSNYISKEQMRKIKNEYNRDNINIYIIITSGYVLLFKH